MEPCPAHIAPLLRLTRAVENDGVPMSTRVLLLLEGVLYVAVWGFVAREVRQVFVIRRKNAGLGFVGALRRYLSNGWNWLEVLNLSVFVVVMAKRYDVYEQVNDLAPQFATEPGRYVDIMREMKNAGVIALQGTRERDALDVTRVKMSNFTSMA